MIREVAGDPCTIIFGHFDFIYCYEKYGPKIFYESSYRRVAHATTMSEVRNLVETIKRLRSEALLPPAGGNEYDQYDNKEVSQDFKTVFEPAGDLKVEEDIDDVEENQTGFLTWKTKRR